MKSRYLVLLLFSIFLTAIGMEKAKGKKKETLKEVVIPITFPPEMIGAILFNLFPKTPFHIKLFPLVEFLPPQLPTEILDKITWPLTGLFYKSILNPKQWEKTWKQTRQERFRKLPTSLKERLERNLKLMAGSIELSQFKLNDPGYNFSTIRPIVGICNDKIITHTYKIHNDQLYNPRQFAIVWDAKTNKKLYDISLWKKDLVAINIQQKVLVAANQSTLYLYSLEKQKKEELNSVIFDTEIKDIKSFINGFLIETQDDLFFYNIETKENKHLSTIGGTFNIVNDKVVFNDKENNIVIYNPYNNEIERLQGHINKIERTSIIYFEPDQKKVIVYDLTSQKKILETAKKDYRFFLHTKSKFIKCNNQEASIIDINTKKEKTLKLQLPHEGRLFQIYATDNDKLLVPEKGCRIVIYDLNSLTKIDTIENISITKTIKNNLMIDDDSIKKVKLLNSDTLKTRLLTGSQNLRLRDIRILDDLIIIRRSEQNKTKIYVYNHNGTLLTDYIPPYNVETLYIGGCSNNLCFFGLPKSTEVTTLIKFSFPSTLEKAEEIIKESLKKSPAY